MSPTPSGASPARNTRNTRDTRGIRDNGNKGNNGEIRGAGNTADTADTAAGGSLSDFELPSFFCPLRPTRHPQTSAIEQGSLAWIDAVGLAGSPGQRQALADTNAAVFCGYILPRGRTERLQWFANWFYWFWAVDAYSDEGAAAMRTAEYVRLVAPIVRMVAAPSEARQSFPLLEAARQCAESFAGFGTPTQFRRWYEEQRNWLLGVAHQVALSEQGRLPDIDEYLMHRLPGSAAAVGLAAVEMVTGHPLPTGLIDTPRVRAMSEMAGFIVALDNDLLSYPLEQHASGSDQNIVNVLMHQGRPIEEAVAQTAAIRDRVMLRFLRLTEDAAAGAEHALRLYIESLHGLVSGNLTWAPNAPRYAGHFPGGAMRVTLTDHTDAPDRPPPYATCSWWWRV